MPLTDHDLSAADNGVSLQLFASSAFNTAAANASAAGLTCGKSGGCAIDFQFPPKITADNRSANWKEVQLGAFEPIPIWGTSSPREITMEWTYLVSDAFDGVWDTTYIHKQVSLLRSYFGGSGLTANQQSDFICLLQIYGIGGQAPFSFRMTSASCKYSKHMVPFRASNSDQNPDWSRAFPLRTDVTAEFKSWSQAGNAGPDAATATANSLTQAVTEAKNAKIVIQGLKSYSTNSGWF